MSILKWSFAEATVSFNLSFYLHQVTAVCTQVREYILNFYHVIITDTVVVGSALQL